MGVLSDITGVEKLGILRKHQPVRAYVSHVYILYSACVCLQAPLAAGASVPKTVRAKQAPQSLLTTAHPLHTR